MATATQLQSYKSAPSFVESKCSGGVLHTILDTLLPFSVNPCWSLLTYLLAVLAVLSIPVLAYRYRDRLARTLPAASGWSGSDPDHVGESESITWPGDPPSDDVRQAWLTMVQRANPDRPWTRTPSECARIAIDRGMNSDAVRTITSLFEEVRYAGVSVTDERQQKARDGLQQLDDSGGS